MQRATRGEVTISPSATQDFADECKKSVDTQLNRKREYRIRMSGLGRPLCQQLLDRSGLVEEMDYNALFRFLFGDLVESVAVLIMEQAGVEIVEKQKAVSLNIAGQTINGTLDLILRDEMGVEKVWDVKSASEWAFKFKYTGYGGYDKIKEDDPFGYISQLSSYVYAAKDDPLVTNKTHGAFLAMDKQNGHLCLDVYDFTEELKTKEEEMLAAKEMVAGPIPSDRVSPIPQSGTSPNTKLAMECSYCDFKKLCWPQMRTFIYSQGPQFLVHVEKEPLVPEVIDEQR